MEALLFPPIPLGEAAAFFVRVKTAAPSPRNARASRASPQLSSEARRALAAEEANEASFYKQKLTEALEELESDRAEAEGTHAELARLEGEVAERDAALGHYQEMASAGLSEATHAHDALLQERQGAAALRIAFQELRGQLLALATQEPPGPPMPSASARDLSVAPDAAASEEPGPVPQQAAPIPKQASAFAPFLRAAKERLPHAVAGGALGALAEAAYVRKGSGPLRAKVERLQGEEAPSFAQAMDLAQAKARLALHDVAEEHPGAAIAAGALGGALLGFNAGPEVVRDFREGASNLKKLRSFW